MFNRILTDPLTWFKNGTCLPDRQRRKDSGMNFSSPVAYTPIPKAIGIGVDFRVILGWIKILFLQEIQIYEGL